MENDKAENVDPEYKNQNPGNNSSFFVVGRIEENC
jgi:hypothetical protein